MKQLLWLYMYIQNVNTVFKKYHLKLNTGCTFILYYFVQEDGAVDKCNLYAVCLLLQKSELGMTSFPVHCTAVVLVRKARKHMFCYAP